MYVKIVDGASYTNNGNTVGDAPVHRHRIGFEKRQAAQGQHFLQ